MVGRSVGWSCIQYGHCCDVLQHGAAWGCMLLLQLFAYNYQRLHAHRVQVHALKYSIRIRTPPILEYSTPYTNLPSIQKIKRRH